MELSERDKAGPNEIKALLSGERLILRETQRAVTPLGRIAVFIAYPRRIDLAGAFRLFVTNRTEAPEAIWRDYNRRADMENRIAELKHDLGADHFCLKQFRATEAVFRAVLLLFNRLAEFQRAAGLPGYREPATIRARIFTCGAIPGRSARRWVLHMGENRGELKTRKPLLANILEWQIPTSPKLNPAMRC